MTARENVINAAKAKGTRFGIITLTEVPRANSPLSAINSQRTGLGMVAICNHSGIFSTGVAKPESKTAGGIKRKIPNVACCWVLESELIKSPEQTIDVK